MIQPSWICDTILRTFCCYCLLSFHNTWTIFFYFLSFWNAELDHHFSFSRCFVVMSATAAGDGISCSRISPPPHHTSSSPSKMILGLFVGNPTLQERHLTQGSAESSAVHTTTTTTTTTKCIRDLDSTLLKVVGLFLDPLFDYFWSEKHFWGPSGS